MDYLESGYVSPWVGAPVREITEDDLLTWEIQLKREGQLPPEVQRRLLGEVTYLQEQVQSLEYDLSVAELGDE